MLHSDLKSTTHQSVIAVVRTHEEAEQAVRLLQNAGVSLQCVSIVSTGPSGVRPGVSRTGRVCRASEEGRRIFAGERRPDGVTIKTTGGMRDEAPGIRSLPRAS